MDVEFLCHNKANEKWNFRLQRVYIYYENLNLEYTLFIFSLKEFSNIISLLLNTYLVIACPMTFREEKSTVCQKEKKKEHPYLFILIQIIVQK